jgi:hypothetical protein
MIKMMMFPKYVHTHLPNDRHDRQQAHHLHRSMNDALQAKVLHLNLDRLTYIFKKILVVFFLSLMERRNAAAQFVCTIKECLDDKDYQEYKILMYRWCAGDLPVLNLCAQMCNLCAPNENAALLLSRFVEFVPAHMKNQCAAIVRQHLKYRKRLRPSATDSGRQAKRKREAVKKYTVVADSSSDLSSSGSSSSDFSALREKRNRKSDDDDRLLPPARAAESSRPSAGRRMHSAKTDNYRVERSSDGAISLIEAKQVQPNDDGEGKALPSWIPDRRKSAGEQQPQRVASPNQSEEDETGADPFDDDTDDDDKEPQLKRKMTASSSSSGTHCIRCTKYIAGNMSAGRCGHVACNDCWDTVFGDTALTKCPRCLAPTHRNRLIPLFI